MQRIKKLGVSIVLLLMGGLSTSSLLAQPLDPFFFASKYCRDSVLTEMRTQVNRTIAQPLRKQNYSEWTGAFWAMELMLYRPTGYDKKIADQLTLLPQTPENIQVSFLQMLYTLYPKMFAANVKAIWPQLKTNKAKAIALEYMAQAALWPDSAALQSFVVSPYYPPYQKRWKLPKPVLPKQKDFLDARFLPGQAVLVSFQYGNRDKPGYLMIRTANGQWLADKKGKPLQFAQLARSITNLPYYITGGNTPQGLFKITGTDTSENNWIGPTPNLQLVMPFEVADNPFFGADTNHLGYYTKLLGPLAKYNQLFQSYEAGQMGRSEIIAHGTTIPPQLYKGQPYFPCTPSLGCLCSPENWNEKGHRINSVQADWMALLVKEKINAQWLVVVEIGR